MATGAVGGWIVAKYRRIRLSEEEYKVAKKRRPASRIHPLLTEAALPAVYRRAAASKGPLSSADVGVLQRSVGNQTTTQLLSGRAGDPASVVQRSLDEEEELPCPGSEIGSEGQGKGLGFGQGEGPIGQPTEEEWGERYGQGEGPITEPEEEE
jgi:hypothetical protein